jgi:hypothetical protein
MKTNAKKWMSGLLALLMMASSASCVEYKGIQNNSSAPVSSSDGASDDVSGSIIPPTEEDVEEEVLSTGEMIQLALAEQGGAYPIGTTIENKHGSVVLTDRWGETIAMRVTLSRNEPLAIYSATAGVWRLTVNGEATEQLPDRVGAYEIVIDFSGDPSLDMIFIENFGVFSISDW